MRSARASEAVRPAGAWQKFRGWRRSRPFWGGLLLILSGLELFLTGNMNLGALQVHVGATGFLSYVIPAMLVLCGGGVLITPHLRLFYGIVGALVAVYSLIGLNFGGFMLGLLLGIIGGALAVAWSPITPAPPAATANDDTGTAETTAYTPAPTNYVDAPGPIAEQYTESQPAYGQAQPYAHSPALDETAEIPRQVQNPERWWGSAHPGSPLRDEEPPPFGENGGGRQPRMMAIALVPVTIAAALVAVVHRATPAYAAPCPTPSASAAAVSGRASARAGAQVTKPGAQGKKPAAQAGTPAVAPQGGQNAAAQSDTAGVAEPAPSTSTAAAPSSQPTTSSNPLTSLWNGLVGGVKKLFGASDPTAPAGATPSAAPSASASPGPSAAPSAGGTSPGASAKPSASAAASSRPRAASTSPCQLSIAAADPGQPPVAVQPGTITGAKQVMRDFTYEGLADLPTATGTKKVLKFSMTSAVTTPFTLKVPEKAGRTTEITSTELAIRSQQHTVTFYTSKFTGTLSQVTLPVIPIPIGVPDLLKSLTTLTFTPDSPPSLLTGITIPEITFENVTLELAFVHSDVLTAQAMHIQPV